MRRLTCTLCTLLALVAAGPVLAQTPEHDHGTTHTDTTVEVSQEGATLLTGVVIDINNDSLVLRTDEGEMEFLLDPELDRSEGITEGTPVNVWFLPGDQMVVTRITVTENGVDTTTTDLHTETDLTATGELEVDTTDTDLDVDLQGDVDADVDTNLDTDLDADFDADVDTRFDDTLPATASRLPLAGGLGLLALFAAVGLALMTRRLG